MTYLKPKPVIDNDSRPFWEAAKEHRLLLQYCPHCESYIFYPRALCPACLDFEPDWREATGRGIVYSYTVARRPAMQAFGDDVPYVVAIVELDEGPRMLTNLMGVEVDQIQIGMRVKVHFDDVDAELTLPKFRPA